MNSCKKQNGSALIISIIVLVMLSILGAAALRATNSELRIVRNEILKEKSFYIAESGIEHGKIIAQEILINQNGDAIDLLEDHSPTSGTFGSEGGSYEINFKENNEGELYINSVGTINNVKSETNLYIGFTHPNPFPHAMVGCDGVEFSGGNVEISSYNFDNFGEIVKNANASVYTTEPGADIDISNSIIRGSVNATGSFSSGPNGKIRDNEDEDVLPNENIPPGICDPIGVQSLIEEMDPDPEFSGENINNSTSLSGTHKLNNINLAGNDELVLTGDSVDLFVEGDISLSGNSQITINEGTEVNIYLQGTLSSTGNNILNNNDKSSSLNIYSNNDSSGDGVQVGGNGQFTGSIYAPFTNTKINGNGIIKGAIRSKTVDSVGNAEFRYDENLAELTSPIPFYKITRWEIM